MHFPGHNIFLPGSMLDAEGIADKDKDCDDSDNVAPTPIETSTPPSLDVDSPPPPLPSSLPPLPPNLTNPILSHPSKAVPLSLNRISNANPPPLAADSIDLATFRQLQQQQHPRPELSDCLSCRLLGGFVPLAISAYVFSVARKSSSKTEKVGCGILGAVLAGLGALRLGDFKLD